MVCPKSVERALAQAEEEMHEGTLAQAALGVVQRAIEEHNIERVSVIRLSVGRMAEVDPEALTFWIGILSEGTPAEGAKIECEEKDATASCPACGAEFDVQPPRWSLVCPRCGSTGSLLSGRELNVVNIEADLKSDTDTTPDNMIESGIAERDQKSGGAEDE